MEYGTSGQLRHRVSVLETVGECLIIMESSSMSVNTKDTKNRNFGRFNFNLILEPNP